MPKAFPARGFTLIELLVAISLTLIVSTFSLAYYSSFNRRQIVEQTAKKIVSDIRLAQNLALAQQKPDTADCLCTDFKGYLFNITGNRYQIVPDCLPVCGVSIKDVELKGVTVSGLTKIKFAVLTQGVEITGGNSLTVTNGSYNRSIIIGAGGDLTIQ